MDDLCSTNVGLNYGCRLLRDTSWEWEPNLDKAVVIKYGYNHIVNLFVT